MHTYALTDRSNEELRRDLDARLVSERGETAWLVAHIAEFDARELHAEAGYDSMHAYCMAVGRLSEDAAYRRLHAARAAARGRPADRTRVDASGAVGSGAAPGR
jgi:hypothetical protein